jgi:hypothetical protein
MSEGLTGQNNSRRDRRERPRFSVNIPLTVYVGERAISACARNVSDRGVYFYLALSDSEAVERDFEFMLQLPPEVTSSTWCAIRGQGRLLRKEVISSEVAGMAAEILECSIVREPPHDP